MTALTQLIPVESMHERKQRMAQLSDFFVALPGGIGTHRAMLTVERDSESLLNRLAAIKHAFVPKVSIRDDKGLLK